MIQNYSTSQRFEEGEEQLVTEKVSSDFRPLQQFVTSCVNTISKEGVRKIGMQGGYVYTDQLRADRMRPTSDQADSLLFVPTDTNYKISLKC